MFRPLSIKKRFIRKRDHFDPDSAKVANDSKEFEKLMASMKSRYANDSEVPKDPRTGPLGRRDSEFGRKRSGAKTVSIMKEIKKNSTYVYFYVGEKKMTFRKGIELLERSPKFRSMVHKIMKSIKGPYIWKITAINKTIDYKRNDKYFKMTFRKSVIPNKSNPTKFMDKLTNDAHSVSKYFALFKSPSGNMMLVPKLPPAGPNAVPGPKYAHIYNYVMHASSEEINDLLIQFAKAAKKFGTDKCYINTHGHDVPWLHIRFDKNPKTIMWA
jgi:hypothetical protein